MEPTTGGEVWLRSFKKECPYACMSKKEDPVHKAEWEEKVFPQEQLVHNPPTQPEEAESNTHLGKHGERWVCWHQRDRHALALAVVQEPLLSRDSAH